MVAGISGCWPDPSTFITQRSLPVEPPSSRTNAICCPLGEIAGWKLMTGSAVLVRLVAPDPFELRIQMSSVPVPLRSKTIRPFCASG